MTSPSASLNRALEAVQRVLEAETGDLHELAKIAGVDENKLFYKADLTGVDLRGVDIDFLLPLETDFEGAVLTNQQREAFRKEGRNLVRKRVTRKIQDIRVEAVTAFIERHEAHDETLFWLTERQDIKPLSGDFLRHLLLEPLLEPPPSNYPHTHSHLITADYINIALSNLLGWLSQENLWFYDKLFRLLASIMAPVNRATGRILEMDYYPELGVDLGGLIAAFRPTYEVDLIWLLLGGPDEVMNSALQIAEERKVDARAVEECLADQPYIEILQFYARIQFDCDNDQAERLAHLLVAPGWPDEITPEILGGKMHPKIRQAVFRQLLAQGKEGRVAAVIRWLDRGRGAAGALSLENAFVHINDFDLAYNLAADLAPLLAQNQRDVIRIALDDLAKTSEQRARIARNHWY